MIREIYMSGYKWIQQLKHQNISPVYVTGIKLVTSNGCISICREGFVSDKNPASIRPTQRESAQLALFCIHIFITPEIQITVYSDSCAKASVICFKPTPIAVAAHESSSPAQTLGSWVLTLLEACMSLCA
jgi:hypothetical protein